MFWAIGSIYTGLGTQLKWPDDFFVFQRQLILKKYRPAGFMPTEGFITKGQAVADGRFNNFSLRLNSDTQHGI